MAKHPLMITFLEGIFRSLHASMVTYSELSPASKGRAREECVIAVLDACLPRRFNVVSGDLLDSKGKSSGQMDGIAVYASAPILRIPLTSVALIPVESAGAVFEVKSNLPTQWDEVRAKYRKVAPLTRLARPGDLAFRPDPYDTVSFHVLALKGFKGPETIAKKLQELIIDSRGRRRAMSIVTLDPPAVTVCTGEMSAHVGPSDPAGIIGQWLSYMLGHLDTFLNPAPHWPSYL